MAPLSKEQVDALARAVPSLDYTWGEAELAEARRVLGHYRQAYPELVWGDLWGEATEASMIAAYQSLRVAGPERARLGREAALLGWLAVVSLPHGTLLPLLDRSAQSKNVS